MFKTYLRFRRVLVISLKSICGSDVTARDMFDDENETEILIWRSIRFVLTTFITFREENV